MQHKLISTKSIEALIDEIDEHIEKGYMPTLAFIYTSVEYDVSQLCSEIGKYPFLIVGSTTVGEIYADNDHGVNTKDASIICMLLDIDASALALTVEDIEGTDYYKLGCDVSKWSKKQFDNPALITISSNLYFDNDDYIRGLQTGVSHFFGGAAGDDRKFINTYVFSGKKLTTSGVLALAIDREKVDIVSSRGFGWSGIGTQRVVTHSEKNIVYTIDDQPAINFYKNYLNITQDDMPNMGADYPLEVELSDGQVVYRAAIYINEENGALVFAGHVEENSKVRISAPIGETIIDHVRESVEASLKNKEQFQADFTLVFPCAAHKSLLGKYKIKEIEAVYQATKKAPLIGFYAYGEIATSSDVNAFHNETFVTVQLREKS